ncbi:Gar1-domain-containing protein [Wallemia mellicola]|nr:Gar1-domain-containing protein [Wallemia mellicola]
MSFRGGGFQGRGGRGGFRGGRQSGGFQQGPPAEVLEMGEFQHAVESDMLCSATLPSKVPYFNAPIYLQNKNQIGKVDEILGPINDVYFTIKMQEGIVATSFSKGDKVYIGSDKLLPIERFLPKPKTEGAKVAKPARGGRGGARGGFAGRGRGAPRGGGGFRGGGRGGKLAPFENFHCTNDHTGRGGFGGGRGRGGY